MAPSPKLSGFLICFFFMLSAPHLFGQQVPKRFQQYLNNQKNPLSRIIGGSNTSVSNYPWQVALVDPTAANNNQGQFCGGAIIDSIWIMTASHCMEGETPRTIKVVAGVTSLLNDTGQERNVTRIIMHPDFGTGPSQIENDIALLRLDKPLDFSNLNVAPIPFATQADADSGLTDPGVPATVMGWGRIDTLNFNTPDTLQAVTVSVLSNSFANNAYQGQVTPDMLAAGDSTGGIDACQGDSGGPLVVANADSSGFILAGIVSWGDGCARPGFPGLYSRVSFFEDWVRQHTLIGLPTSGPFALDARISGLMLNRDQTADCGIDSTSITTTLTLSNEGTDSLASVQILYLLNNDTLLVDSRTFSPPLGTGCSFFIDEQSFTIPTDSALTFQAIAIQPNGQTDLNPANDTLSEALTFPEGYQVAFSLTTVDAPTFMAWGISDAQTGDLVYPSDFFELYFVPGTYRDTICLPPGDYEMTLIDNFGDGLDAPGTFSFTILTDTTHYTILEHWPDFTEVATVNFSLPFDPFFDGRVDISSPEDSTDLIVCTPLVNGEIRLTNVGSLPLRSALVDVKVNGSIVPVDTFTFYLPSGNSETFPVDSFELLENDNLLEATLVDINQGETDRLSENDSSQSMISVMFDSASIGTRLVFQTDGFPEENRWEIADSTGTVVEFRNSFPDPSSTYRQQFCQSEGCYTFTLFDDFGDGIDVPTPVDFTLSDGQLLFTLNGSFTNSVSADYCLINPPVNLTANMDRDTLLVHLLWEDRSQIESAYLVERADSAGAPFVQIASLPANTTVFADDSINEGFRYVYRVRAQKEMQASTYSNEAALENLTGISEGLPNGWKIYPNPASSYVGFQFSGELAREQIFTVSFVDLQGRIALRKHISSLDPNPISVKNLSKGIYIVHVSGSKGAGFKKIAVQ